MKMAEDVAANVEAAAKWVTEAHKKGAQIILLPELFASWYFCAHQRDEDFALAHPIDKHPFIPRFQELAKKLGVVLPISFFEKAGQAHFNSLAMIDADGALLGVYRKTHIPDGPGYQEKFFFNPGDTGFKVWKTKFGNIGVGICWDQWFPEAARAMVLEGADLLLYPTAIGSEPAEAGELDTSKMWQRAMIGHAVSNSCYLAAPNRVGNEHLSTFYGHSFIADYCGEKIAEAGSTEEKVLTADLDFAAQRTFRASMGFFRDRRPEYYSRLNKL